MTHPPTGEKSARSRGGRQSWDPKGGQCDGENTGLPDRPNNTSIGAEEDASPHGPLCPGERREGQRASREVSYWALRAISISLSSAQGGFVSVPILSFFSSAIFCFSSS